MSELPSPYINKDYPRWADTAIRTVRSGIYCSAVVMGIGLIWTQPNDNVLSRWLIEGTGWLALVFGSMCLLATLFHRWIFEWLGLTFINFSIFVFVVQIWSGLANSWIGLASAGAITMLFLGNILRFVDLTVFYIKYQRVATIRNKVESYGSE